MPRRKFLGIVRKLVNWKVCSYSNNNSEEEKSLWEPKKTFTGGIRSPKERRALGAKEEIGAVITGKEQFYLVKKNLQG